MTINSDVSRARYVGNGVTTNFAIPFPYLTNYDGTAQIAVYLSDSDIPLVEGKDYTVTGFGKYSDYSEQVDEGLITYETRYEGGEVLLKVAPENQVPVAIIRNIPQTQGVVFVEGEEFPAQDFENALDKLTMQMQEVKENLQRSIWLPPTSTEKPIEIRDNILDAANEAEQVANEAIKLVEAAPAKIEEITNQAITEIGSATQNSIENINNTTEQSNEIILANVEKSRIWAEGEQTEVQELGGELSSMGAADLAYAIANAPEDTPIDASGLFAMNVVKGEKGDKGDKGDDGKDGKDGKDGGGLEIGDIAPTVFGIDEIKNLRRYLNGQVISQTQFVAFTNIIKERAKLYPNIITTEENWQAEVTNSKLGQCGKFVIDDTLDTIRLPKVVNINGLQDLALMGNIKAESLPNITGEFAVSGGGWFDGGIKKGAFTLGDSGLPNCKSSGDNNSALVNFNASNSSSTYQDNAPVQQEAIQYPYFIQVATGVEESVDVTREIELNNPFSLLDYKWSEYELNNASWLLSNGSFHSGTVYTSVYELLLKIYNGTENKEGVSVKLSTEEYSDTDFVLNTADTTFRLPIKVKLASGNAVVGNGMALGWTDGAGNYGAPYLEKDSTNRINNGTHCYGQILPYDEDTVSGVQWSNNGSVIGITTDPTKSGIETSSSGLYLYFYVGETIQDANVINASGVLSRVSKLSDSYISGLGMPSNKYIDLTLGASGTEYVAPANGWFYVSKVSTASGQWFGFENNTSNLASYSWSSNTGQTITNRLEVKKGDVVAVIYNIAGTLNFFRFIYAEGEI